MSKRDAVEHLAYLVPHRSERWFGRNLSTLMALDPADFSFQSAAFAVVGSDPTPTRLDLPRLRPHPRQPLGGLVNHYTIDGVLRDVITGQRVLVICRGRDVAEFLDRAHEIGGFTIRRANGQQAISHGDGIVRFAHIEPATRGHAPDIVVIDESAGIIAPNRVAPLTATGARVVYV